MRCSPAYLVGDVVAATVDQLGRVHQLHGPAAGSPHHARGEAAADRGSVQPATGRCRTTYQSGQLAALNELKASGEAQSVRQVQLVVVAEEENRELHTRVFRSVLVGRVGNAQKMSVVFLDDGGATFCTNPTSFTVQGSYPSGSLGTGARCYQTSSTIHGRRCSNFASTRTLKVNGTTETCNGGYWPAIPAKVNGGYCIQIGSGNYSNANFSVG
jgi:hypothetical protein